MLLCFLALVAILLALLIKPSEKYAVNSQAQLRWNPNGITLMDIKRISGVTSNNAFSPYGLAFDSTGALYVADILSHRVLKLNRERTIIKLVAGQANGILGNDSDHLNQPVHMAFDSNDNMYLSDRENNRIQFFNYGNSTGRTVVGITGKISSKISQIYKYFGDIHRYSWKYYLSSQPPIRFNL